MIYRKLLLLGVSIFLASCQSSTPAPTASIQIDSEQTEVADDNHKKPVNRPATHTVQSGETLIEISLKYGLDYREVARWNFMTNPDLIEVGQKLKLSAPKFEPEVTAVAKAQTQKPKLEVVSSQEAEKIAKLQPADRTTAPSVRRRQTLIENEQVSTTTARLITNPQAIKLPYSEEAKLRLQGRQTTPATAASLKTSPTGPSATRTRSKIVWSWPVDGTVTSKYSNERRGIDIAGKRGEPIHSSADGKVIYAGSGIKGYGQVVIVRHKDEYVSVYAHNDKIFVAEGDTVSRGQPISAMGDTGAKQVGLHFQIRQGSEKFDPQQYLPPNP